MKNFFIIFYHFQLTLHFKDLAIFVSQALISLLMFPDDYTYYACIVFTPILITASPFLSALAKIACKIAPK